MRGNFCTFRWQITSPAVAAVPGKAFRDLLVQYFKTRAGAALDMV